MYATLDVFGLFAKAKFEFLASVVPQTAEQIAQQVTDSYKTTTQNKVKTLEETIADNSKDISQLEALNDDAKQCYADCGNIQQCTVTYEQCKDPWNTDAYTEDCRRTSSCTANERKSQVCTSAPWYAKWKCESFTDQCCSRKLNDDKAALCKEDYDSCIKPKSRFWDILGAVFTGELDVAWCLNKCKAAEISVAAQAERLKMKNLALATVNSASKGAQKLAAAIVKFIGKIISITNITAYGVLEPTGQKLDFQIHMAVLGIPVRSACSTAPLQVKPLLVRHLRPYSLQYPAGSAFKDVRVMHVIVCR